VSGGELTRSELAPNLLLGEGVEIGQEVAIGANVVIHAGVEIGAGARIGDHAQLREGARIGVGTTVGSYCSVDPGVLIGARVSIQTRCYLARGAIVEDDAFLGPAVTLTNDNTMGRHAVGEELHGVRVGRACRIGAGSIVCPGLSIGAEAFVAAGAVVIADVVPRSVVAGVPAREIRTVPDTDLLENWR
jgi:acetyltransferase-like isoleucine patch superfamily enzyme